MYIAYKCNYFLYIVGDKQHMQQRFFQWDVSTETLLSLDFMLKKVFHRYWFFIKNLEHINYCMLTDLFLKESYSSNCSKHKSFHYLFRLNYLCVLLTVDSNTIDVNGYGHVTDLYTIKRTETDIQRCPSINMLFDVVLYLRLRAWSIIKKGWVWDRTPSGQLMGERTGTEWRRGLWT